MYKELIKSTLTFLVAIYLFFAIVYNLYKTHDDRIHVSILKIDNISDKTETIWLSNYYRATSTPLAGEVMPSEIYIRKGDRPQVTEGSVVDLYVQPFRSKTWGDFFKLFWGKFDYRVLAVSKILVDNSSNEAQKTLEEERAKRNNELGFPWLILIGIIGLGFLTTKFVPKKFNNRSMGWLFRKPYWLEISNTILGSTATLFCFYLAYVSFKDGAYASLIGMALLGLTAFFIAVSEYTNRNDYLQINDEGIKYRDDALIAFIKFSEIKLISIIYKDKDSDCGSIKFLKSDFKEITITLSELGLSSQGYEVQKIFQDYAKKKNIEINYFTVTPEKKS